MRPLRALGAPLLPFALLAGCGGTGDVAVGTTPAPAAPTVTTTTEPAWATAPAAAPESEPPAPVPTTEATATPTPTEGPTHPPVLAPDCDALSTEPPADGPLSADPEVAAAQRARAGMGLASDEATVTAIMAGGGDDGVWGFPLTEAEAAQLERLDRREHDAVFEWALGRAGEHFAGVWLDTAAGMVLTVAFTHDVDTYRAEAHERFGADVRVVEAVRSYDELQRLQRRIMEETVWLADPDAAPQPGEVSYVTVEEQHNRVAVSVFGGSEQERAALSERYGGERICVVLAPVPVAEGATVARWAPAPGADLSPQSTEVEVLVSEQACAGGQDASGRIVPPEVAYDDEAVVVTLRVTPLAGAADCPANPATPFVVVLDEPLGDRALLDGGVDPPAPPDLFRSG